MCFDSPEVRHVYDFLQHEPILQSLLHPHDNNNDDDASVQNIESPSAKSTDVGRIPLYRWWHIRDYSLRIDPGRFGYPCMCIAMHDDNDDDTRTIRQETWNSTLEYLMQSERVIATGPLYPPTESKADLTHTKAAPLGDLLLFNAKHREDAIQFCEDLPTAQAGLYGKMRVHFYNSLDITGKFVSEDPLRDAPGEQMKEALEYWGYPVADEQTPWLNW
jgi:uncharacterized protein YciI